MLFVVLFIVIFVAAGAHIALARPMTAARAVELFLVYLLAGYYGLCMLFAALIHLLNGPAVARMKDGRKEIRFRPSTPLR